MRWSSCSLHLLDPRLILSKFTVDWWERGSGIYWPALPFPLSVMKLMTLQERAIKYVLSLQDQDWLSASIFLNVQETWHLGAPTQPGCRLVPWGTFSSWRFWSWCERRAKLVENSTLGRSMETFTKRGSNGADHGTGHFQDACHNMRSVNSCSPDSFLGVLTSSRSGYRCSVPSWVLIGVGFDKWSSQCASLGAQNRLDVLGGLALNAIVNQPLPASPPAVSYQGIGAHHVVSSFGKGMRREAARRAMTKHADDVRIIRIYCIRFIHFFSIYIKFVLFKDAWRSLVEVTILQKKYDASDQLVFLSLQSDLGSLLVWFFSTYHMIQRA